MEDYARQRWNWQVRYSTRESLRASKLRLKVPPMPRRSIVSLRSALLSPIGVQNEGDFDKLKIEVRYKAVLQQAFAHAKYASRLAWLT